jgi:hypothetical protein
LSKGAVVGPAIEVTRRMPSALTSIEIHSRACDTNASPHILR